MVPPRLRLAPLRCPRRGRNSRLGTARRRSYRTVPSPATERDARADVGVEQHGGEQHRAQEDAVPVVVDAGVADADLHDTEDQRADRSAYDRTVAAAQQAATDDGRDDRLELLLQSTIGRR